MKIVMIGPVYPYKGGIAHYTSLMIKNLAKEHDVVSVSFKLQYPKHLYRHEQKDLSNDFFKTESTNFIINTVNPLSWISSAFFINRHKPDLVLVQWWHPFFSPAYWSILKMLKRKTRVIFACHNVFPHESFPIKKFLTRSVLRQGDGYIVHSQTDVSDLNSLLNLPDYRLTVIPTFNAFKIKNMSKIDARNILSIDPAETVLLFFGFIREYKGLKHLIRALPIIINKIPNTRLLIVGDFFENDREDYFELFSQTGVKNRITLVEGYVPDADVEKYFAASDLVVLPYESATQSGIVQIAYSFDKPVIATNVGGLPEVVLDGQTGFIVPAFSEEELAAAVICYFSENKAEEFEKNIKLEAYRYSWDRMNEVVNDLGRIKK